MNAALILLIILALCAAASTVSGVYLLAGLGWSLIALGLQLFGAAAVLRKGLTVDG